MKIDIPQSSYHYHTSPTYRFPLSQNIIFQITKTGASEAAGLVCRQFCILFACNNLKQKRCIAVFIFAYLPMNSFSYFSWRCSGGDKPLRMQSGLRACVAPSRDAGRDSLNSALENYCTLRQHRAHTVRASLRARACLWACWSGDERDAGRGRTDALNAAEGSSIHDATQRLSQPTAC
jgi:hypothetical protein